MRTGLIATGEIAANAFPIFPCGCQAVRAVHAGPRMRLLLQRERLGAPGLLLRAGQYGLHGARSVGQVSHREPADAVRTPNTQLRCH